MLQLTLIQSFIRASSSTSTMVVVLISLSSVLLSVINLVTSTFPSSVLESLAVVVSSTSHRTHQLLYSVVHSSRLKARTNSLRMLNKSLSQLTSLTRQVGRTFIYVTECCVFQLTKEGIELIEVAPGVDIEKDILAHMDFKPIIKDVKVMDERIFKDEIMGLAK